ncbi:MAG: hypothetical protein MUF10_16920 [Thermoanaerobaculaceae bacterium]|nr:hypothetical protein [Thermoanaerobaculaceae bacterium]
MSHQQHNPADAEVIRSNRREIAHLSCLAFRRARPFDVIADWKLPSSCEMVSHLLQGQAALDYARIRHLLCFCALLGSIETGRLGRRFDLLAGESSAVLATQGSQRDRAAPAREVWPAIGSGCPRVGEALEKNMLASHGWVPRRGFWLLDKRTNLVAFSRDWGTYRPHLDARISFPCLRLDSLPLECSKFFAIDTNSFLSYSMPDSFEEHYEKFLRLLIILGNEVRRLVEAPVG